VAAAGNDSGSMRAHMGDTTPSIYGGKFIMPVKGKVVAVLGPLSTLPHPEETSLTHPPGGATECGGDAFGEFADLVATSTGGISAYPLPGNLSLPGSGPTIMSRR